jgi:hypothetical protein
MSSPKERGGGLRALGDAWGQVEIARSRLATAGTLLVVDAERPYGLVPEPGNLAEPLGGTVSILLETLDTLTQAAAVDEQAPPWLGHCSDSPCSTCSPAWTAQPGSFTTRQTALSLLPARSHPSSTASRSIRDHCHRPHRRRLAAVPSRRRAHPPPLRQGTRAAAQPVPVARPRPLRLGAAARRVPGRAPVVSRSRTAPVPVAGTGAAALSASVCAVTSTELRGRRGRGPWICTPSRHIRRSIPS